MKKKYFWNASILFTLQKFNVGESFRLMPHLAFKWLFMLCVCVCVNQGIYTLWGKISLRVYGDKFYICLDSHVEI